MGGDKKILKRGGKAGSRGGGLKKEGGLEPLYELWLLYAGCFFKFYFSTDDIF